MAPTAVDEILSVRLRQRTTAGMYVHDAFMGNIMVYWNEPSLDAFVFGLDVIEYLLPLTSIDEAAHWRAYTSSESLRSLFSDFVVAHVDADGGARHAKKASWRSLYACHYLKESIRYLVLRAPGSNEPKRPVGRDDFDELLTPRNTNRLIDFIMHSADPDGGFREPPDGPRVLTTGIGYQLLNDLGVDPPNERSEFEFLGRMWRRFYSPTDHDDEVLMGCRNEPESGIAWVGPTRTCLTMWLRAATRPVPLENDEMSNILRLHLTELISFLQECKTDEGGAYSSAPGEPPNLIATEEIVLLARSMQRVLDESPEASDFVRDTAQSIVGGIDIDAKGIVNYLSSLHSTKGLAWSEGGIENLHALRSGSRILNALSTRHDCPELAPIASSLLRSLRHYRHRSRTFTAFPGAVPAI